MHGTLHSAPPANPASASLYRPPAPIPQSKPLGVLGLISTLKRNPLECWTREHFEKPVVVGGLPFKHCYGKAEALRSESEVVVRS